MLWALGWIGVLTAALVGLAGFRVVRVVQRVNETRAAIQQAAAAVQRGDIRGGQAALATAERRIIAANTDVHQAPELDVLGLFPIVRQNVHALRSTVDLSLAMVNGGRRVLDAAAPLAGPNGQVQVPLRTGQIPLPVIVRSRREVQDLAAVLPGPSEQPDTRFVVGPLAHIHRRIFAEAAKRKVQFDSVGAGLQLLEDMAGANGPRRYLIAVANTAEMRGSGGMILSYAVLSSQDGKFTLDANGPIDDLLLDQPAPVRGEPADYLTRYADLEPTLRWRNANLSADFTAVGPVLEAMYQKATGKTADGVIQIDPQGLAAILRGIGPVEVPELGVITADNVVAITLNDAYTRFPNRSIRREFLASVAEVVFNKLVTGDYPTLRPLATSLIRVAPGRHILMHTIQEDGQRAAVQLGVDGGLPRPELDQANLTVQNFGGNKLDYYLDSSLEITGSRRPDEPGNVKARITLTNTAPADGTPPYIFGPLLPTFERGEYRGLVTLYLPRGTRLVGSSGGPVIGEPSLSGEEGRSVVSFGVSVKAGEARVVTLELALPSRPKRGYVWEFVPQPRVRPTMLRVDLRTGASPLRANASLDRVVAVGGPS